MNYTEVYRIEHYNVIGFFGFAKDQFNKYEGLVGIRSRGLNENISDIRTIELIFELFPDHHVVIPLYKNFESYQTYGNYLGVYHLGVLFVYTLDSVFDSKGLVKDSFTNRKIPCSSYSMSSEGIYVIQNNNIVLHRYDGNSEFIYSRFEDHEIVGSWGQYVFTQGTTTKFILCHHPSWRGIKRLNKNILKFGCSKTSPYFFIRFSVGLLSESLAVYKLSDESALVKIKEIDIETNNIRWIGENLLIEDMLYSEDMSTSQKFFTKHIQYINEDGTRVIHNNKLFENIVRVPERRLIRSRQDFIDERLFRISFPYAFHFVKDSEGRKFFLFSDAHQSNKNVCYGISLYDNIKALAEARPDLTFDYYLEGEFMKNDENHLPMHSMINISTDCIGKQQPRDGCIPNVWYHWIEIRNNYFDDLLLEIFNEHYQDFHLAFSKGSILQYFINYFEKRVSDQTLRLFFNSIQEFRENFEGKYNTAIKVLEKEFAIRIITLLFPDRHQGIVEFFKRTLKYYDIARMFNQEIIIHRIETFSLYLGVILFDLNYISRVEHHYRTHIPSNILYYAGGMHVYNFLEYLKEIGIVEEEFYGEQTNVFKGIQNYNRCIYLEKPLTEFLEQWK